jgi:hypothetical protein
VAAARAEPLGRHTGLVSGLRDVAGFDDRYVVPYYLPMMGYNAVGAETAILTSSGAELTTSTLRTFGGCRVKPGGPGPWAPGTRSPCDDRI